MQNIRKQNMWALLIAIVLYAAFLVTHNFGIEVFDLPALEFLDPIGWFAALLYVSLLYCCVLSLMLLRFDKSLQEQCALIKPRLLPFVFWVIVGLIASSIIWVTRAQETLIVPAWWESYTLQHVHSAIIMWISIILIGPFFEEMLFRGFIFSNLLASPLGRALTVVITTYIWVVPISRPTEFELLSRIILGLLFAVARLQTRSIYTPFAMHASYKLLEVIMFTAL